jgi:hypothetical protein
VATTWIVIARGASLLKDRRSRARGLVAELAETIDHRLNAPPELDDPLNRILSNLLPRIPSSIERRKGSASARRDRDRSPTQCSIRAHEPAKKKITPLKPTEHHLAQHPLLASAALNCGLSRRRFLSPPKIERLRHLYKSLQTTIQMSQSSVGPLIEFTIKMTGPASDSGIRAHP